MKQPVSLDDNLFVVGIYQDVSNLHKSNKRVSVIFSVRFATDLLRTTTGCGIAPSFTKMSPYMENSGSLSPLVTDGEVPAVYPETLKNRATTKVNGIGHNIKAAAAESTTSVPFYNKFALKPRKLRIITIGAGFSGLLLAHKFQHRFPELQEFIHHSMYEARSDVGGTWLVNTYPGVQCDVPSHIYVSFMSMGSG